MKFIPRDISCNRIPVYENGTWVRDQVRDEFEFNTIDELKLTLTNTFEHKLSDNFKVENNAVINGLCIGWIKDSF